MRNAGERWVTDARVMAGIRGILRPVLRLPGSGIRDVLKPTAKKLYFKLRSYRNAITTHVLHSELLGARSSSICDVFVLMRKKEFLSAASWRTRVSASMLIMGLTGLLFTDSGVCKFFR